MPIELHQPDDGFLDDHSPSGPVAPAGDPEDPVCRYLRDHHGYVITRTMVEGPQALGDPLVPLWRTIRAMATEVSGDRVKADRTDATIAALIAAAVDCQARLERHDPDPHHLIPVDDQPPAAAAA